MTEDAVPQIFDAWRLIGSADTTGKRSIVRCLACGSVHTVSHEMLTTSHVVCTGCNSPAYGADRSRSLGRSATVADVLPMRKRG
jgi:hypothetical protein